MENNLDSFQHMSRVAMTRMASPFGWIVAMDIDAELVKLPEAERE